MDNLQILELVGVGYKKGFLDGVNRGRMDEGLPELNEIDLGGYSEVVEDVIKKLLEDEMKA